MLPLFMVLLGMPYEVGRNAFYDAWHSGTETSRVDSLLALLAREPDLPDYFRGLAWMYCCADSTRADSVLTLWIDELPGDPRAWFIASDVALDSFPERALIAATRGLEAFGRWHPEGIPAEEWKLVGRALGCNLRFNRCRGFYGMGDRMAALEELEPLLEPRLFSVNDHHTGAPYLFYAGGAYIETGDTLRGVELLLRAASEGDMADLWGSRADSTLNAILGDRYLAKCREIVGYDGPVFTDASGLLPGPVPGTRHCWGDIDGDGRPDLLAGGTVLLNRPEGFELLDSLPVNGGVLADLDNDGLVDILGLGRQPLLFIQMPDGTFMETAREMGLSPVEAQIEGAAALDWNGDGFLDIYLAVYEDPDTMGLGRPDAFYLGGPEGFTRASVFELDPPLCGRSVSVVDLEGDGRQSMLVSNYRLDPNVFWESVEGIPVNTAPFRGLEGVQVKGAWGHTIGSAWCDFDLDGDIDVFSANLAHPRYIVFSNRSMLLRNDGGRFTDVRAEMGIKYEETHSFPVWADFDSDGLPDLYITSVYPGRRSFLYLNTGNGFQDVTWLSGARVMDGWQVSAVDFDCDGKPDLAVNAGGYMRLYGNTGVNGSLQNGSIRGILRTSEGE